MCFLPACFSRSATKVKTPLVISSNNSIITKGVGYPDKSFTDKQIMQREGKARRDALVDAQTKMLFAVSDFIMKSGDTVGRKMQQDNDFTTRVNDAVNQAEVMDQDCVKDSVCTVTLRLKKDDFEKAIGAEVSR